jgi:hypothetical protein
MSISPAKVLVHAEFWLLPWDDRPLQISCAVIVQTSRTIIFMFEPLPWAPPATVGLFD